MLVYPFAKVVLPEERPEKALRRASYVPSAPIVPDSAWVPDVPQSQVEIGAFLENSAL